jgi:Domain of unknown function (DUF4747)
VARIVISVLNLTLQPHEAGTYLRLLETAARLRREVPFYGDRRARLGPVHRVEDARFALTGGLNTYERIDLEGEWFNEASNDVAGDEDRANLVIPDHLHPNLRRMNFIFNSQNHRLYFEARTSEGHKFAPRAVKRAFDYLFSDRRLIDMFGPVDITIIPSVDSLERIFSIPELRRLRIRLLRPNPDDLHEAEARLLEKLATQNASRQDLELVRERRAVSLTPDEDTKLLAVIAANNGFVEGQGISAEGSPVSESTRDHPEQTIVEYDERMRGPLATLIDYVRNLLP